MRAGVYTINNKIGTIKYHDGTTLNVVKKAMTTKRDQLLQLAESLSTAGPVLIVSKGKKTSQNYAEQLVGLKESWGTLTPLSNAEYESPEIQRLDSRIEREIDKSSTLRGLLRYRIVFHHAGLPPRVRISIEDAIRAGYIDFVVATTTLAEGVNFPFSSVVIQSLAFREFPERGKPASYQPVTPRSFWNIAGRAGRPGYDNEGQVVLFGPSLDLDKTHNVIEDYLDPSINKIAPVQSSLATVIKELIDRINNDEITLDDLTHINFKHSVPKKIQGAVNLLRTGIIHAKASSSSHSISNLLNDSYAIQFLNPHEQTIANRLISNQSKLVDEFAADNDDNVVSLLSELGISLGTYVEFKDYVVSLQDWQLEKMSEVIIAGSINFTQAKFIVGPVASRMSELEGSKLGGVLCDVIIDWLRGIQISKIKTGKAKMNSLEDLINVLYSRIQFLLPWGLFVFNHIVRTECENRNIGYHDEILSLSYLVDAGVPNYDALRLTKLDFERVDSTRLSKAYKRVREDIDYDLLGWLIFEPKENLRRIVYGKDHRRIDYDFNSLIDSIKTSVV